MSDTKVLQELIDRARSNDPVERIRGKPENRLAKGVSPLEGMESDYSEPYTEGASILGDGAYGSRKNIQDCVDKGIKPLMRLQTNLTTKGKGTGYAWGHAVRDQLGGSPEASITDLTKEEREECREYWKTRVGYGRRWTVERSISALKRIFGEYVRSRT